MNKRKKHTKHWLMALSTAVAVTSIAPAAVFADQAKPGHSSSASSGGTSEAQIDPNSEAPVNTAITKEKAVALAKSYVSVPDDYKLQSVNLYSQNRDATTNNVWNLTFVKTVNGKFKGSIDTSIDANSGSLIGFNTYVDDPGAKPSYPLKVNREQADGVARSFIAKISPKLKDQIQLDADYGADLKPPLNGQVRHSLRYNRLIDGLPFVDNYIMLDVDSEGRVMSYQVNWNNDLKVVPQKPGLTNEAALAKIREVAKPQLVYVVPYTSKQPRKPILSYELPSITLDAVTGEVKTDGVSYWQLAKNPVADKALGTKPAGGKSLTVKQAEEEVRKQFDVPSDVKQVRSSYNEYQDENSGITTATWNLSWTRMDGDKEIGSVQATVDSTTGAILNYGSYTWQGEENKDAKRISYSDARSKALEVVKKQLPWLANQLYLNEPSEAELKRQSEQQTSDYYFNFARKVNGARVDYDNVNITIEAYKGNVRDYYGNISTFDYPASAPSLIESNKAVDAWLNYYKLELTYVMDSAYQLNGQPIPEEKYRLMVASGDIQPGLNQSDAKLNLVYRLVPKPIDEQVFLDAESGQWRNRETGDPASLEKPVATDISGHWAQRELELMTAYKALDIQDGKVRPNQVITRGELIKMLVLSINSGRQPRPYEMAATAGKAFSDVKSDSGYFVYVQNALELNLIDIGDGSFNPEGKVDRGEMAELIVRALGFNSLAAHSDLFKATFKDADQTKQKGQAAIVVGLGIMSLQDGKFAPERDVTRAEAATAFFRFLSARADLQEAPLRN